VLDTYDSEDQVRLQIADSGVGPPSEQDVEWAAEIGAHILCFNTSIPNRIQEMANQQKVELEKFNVIYKLVERLKVTL
jgi:translation initiation factor IF-2